MNANNAKLASKRAACKGKKREGEKLSFMLRKKANTKGVYS